MGAKNFFKSAGIKAKNFTNKYIYQSALKPAGITAKDFTIKKIAESIGLAQHKQLQEIQAQEAQAIKMMAQATTAQEKFAAMQLAAQLKAQKAQLQAERNRRAALTLIVAFAFFLFLAAGLGLYLMYAGYAGPFSVEWRSVYGTIFNQVFRFIQPIWSIGAEGFNDLQCALSNPLSCAALQHSSVSYPIPTFNMFSSLYPIPQSRDIPVDSSYPWAVEIQDQSIFGINTGGPYGGVSSSFFAKCADSICNVLICGNPSGSCTISSKYFQVSSGGSAFVSFTISPHCPACPNKIQWINATFCQNNSNPFPLVLSFNDIVSTSAAAMLMVPIEFINSSFSSALTSNDIPVPFSGPTANTALGGPVQVNVNVILPNPIINSVGQVALEITISDTDFNENSLTIQSLCVLLPPGISAGSNNGEYWRGGSATGVGNFYLPSYATYCATQKYINATTKSGAPFYFDIETNVPNNQLINGLPIIVVADYKINEIFPDYAIVVSPIQRNPCFNSGASVSQSNSTNSNSSLILPYPPGI
jgi:hypothetical protein